MGILDEADKPIISDVGGFLSRFTKSDKVKVIIYYPDHSATEYFKEIPDGYFITIDNRKYIFTPRALVNITKQPEIRYFFNNPKPINFDYQIPDLTIADLYDRDKMNQIKKGDPDAYLIAVNTILDGKAINGAFNSKFFRYNLGDSGINLKQIGLIVGAVLFLVLVFLQLSGKVDVLGSLKGAVTSVSNSVR